MGQDAINAMQKELLQDASKEILRLRRDNSIYSARLQMFDDMMLLFRTQPSWGSGMVSGAGEDIAWRIERFIKNMETVDASNKP